MDRLSSSSGPFGVFADELLRVELPDLPDAARAETVAFVCRRADLAAAPLRAGLVMLAIALAAFQRLLGVARSTALVRATTLPLIGELPRVVRAVGFAYVWETWPDSSPTGQPAAAGIAA